jgi:hypothetical protein
MKKFHITYFVERQPLLISGKTVYAESIVYAIGKFLQMNEEVSVEDIHYAIEIFES